MSTRTIASLFALHVIAAISATHGEQVLVDLGEPLDLRAIPARAVALSLRGEGKGRALRLETNTGHAWPGIDLKAPGGKWDLSKHGHVAVDVTNCGTKEVTVCLRVDNPGADGRKNCLTERVELKPGSEGTITVKLPQGSAAGESLQFVGMRGTPIDGAAKLDPGNVVNLVIFTPKPKTAHAFEVTNIRAGGKPDRGSSGDLPDPFFPMIDEFGQYMHKDWPGKTHSLGEMHSRIAEEATDLATHPGPEGWNRFGGWAKGPQLEATGFFRVAKHRDKWWLVDPEGRLFWSNGIDGIRDANATPITGREHYYAALPAEDSPFGQFYSPGKWAPRGYYKDKGGYRQYDFTRANLLRKYGVNWQDRFAGLSHRRLRSWGVNTMANWSSEAIYLKRKTPYVVAVHFGSPDLRASKGMWKKFSDVFDPGFREGLAKRLAREAGKSAGDPWCIGYFVDNELGWGKDVSLAVATLCCPADQPAKRAFVADLKAKYREIAALNTAWGTSHSSWEALLAAMGAPDVKKAGGDLRDFYSKTAETYFRTVREEVKRIAPEQLYLGCRFSNRNDRAVRAAAVYCDVISFNRYTYSVERDRLPKGIDKPMIIGEFHFGALDRGMFHTGLRKADNQEHLASGKCAWLGNLAAQSGFLCQSGFNWVRDV
ncbi:MAG: beta-agarase [Lentisphaerae bacterium]|jgi:hypothetical protein|nr:beta-agarase [Lentisphaerota bacterium]